MKTIICLGDRACDLGENYEIKAAKHVIKLLDVGIEGDNCYAIPFQPTAELYEKNTPDLTSFFSDITNDITFIISGESEAANCSLKILQQIKDKKITIVYLKPQNDFLSSKQTNQEKVIRNVLQEYVRSGLLNKMVLFDIRMVEDAMGETAIANHESQLNSTIVSLLDFYFSVGLIDPIIDYTNKPKEISNIVTLGYYYLVNDIEKLCYNLSAVDDKLYYFYFTEKSLEEKVLLKTIKEKIKTKAGSGATQVSFAVNKSAHDRDFCFVVYYTKTTGQ